MLRYFFQTADLAGWGCCPAQTRPVTKPYFSFPASQATVLGGPKPLVLWG